MSSHHTRRRAVDPRAAGRRRITGATTVSAVGGTALAVFFGSLFAQSFAEASAPTKAAPVQAATAALSLTDKADAAPRHELTAPTTKPHASTAKPYKAAAPAPKAAPQPPAAAPQAAEGTPAGSSGGS